MSNSKDEIIKIERECADAFNQQDLGKILDSFDESIFGFSSTRQERFIGKAELKKTFEYYFLQGDRVTYEITVPEVELIGDSLAICTFYWQVNIRDGSKSKEIPGRASHVYRNIGGQWKIVHEHFSRAH